jgi:hypothetical protein
VKAGEALVTLVVAAVTGSITYRLTQACRITPLVEMPSKEGERIHA